MEWLSGARIALTPRPVRRREAALEAAMLGHCPGRVRLDRLRALGGALEEMRGAGYGGAVDTLLQEETPSLERLGGLFHLPLPLRSSAEFHDIFPDAATEAANYVSLLAGRRAWLAQSVDDFFANGGEKLWVVRIPEEEKQGGFLPAPGTRLHETETLRGLATVLVIPSVGLVAMPDLERLQIPARLPDRPEVASPDPAPQFLPCDAGIGSGEDAPPYESELGTMPDPGALEELLRGILQFTARHRPDIQCLLTLPLDYSGVIDGPAVSQRALDRIRAIRDGASGHLLRHMQFLFPYLRGPRFALQSPVGVVAGKQAAVSRAKGPWRSISAQSLVSEALPYPRLSLSQTIALREDPGIGVVRQETDVRGRRRLTLDDERLAVPALPPEDYAGHEDRSRFDGFRSAEIMRFLGFLRRRLQALGEQLVFDIDPDDPRPRLLLEQFFRQLYDQGALRGDRPDEAYRIRQSHPREEAIQFDIEIAPAFPIDRIFLTFINAGGEWRGEIVHG